MCTNSAFPSRLPGITITLLYGGYEFEYELCNLASYLSVLDGNVASIFSVWIPNLQATLPYPSSLCNGLHFFVYRMCLVQILVSRSGWFSLFPSFPAGKYWCNVPYKNIGSFRIFPASFLIHPPPISHSPLWGKVCDRSRCYSRKNRVMHVCRSRRGIFRYSVEPGYNDIGLCDTSSVASDIP